MAAGPQVCSRILKLNRAIEFFWSREVFGSNFTFMAKVFTVTSRFEILANGNV